METKFEYQVSAEQAEQIALEQYRLLLRLRGLRPFYFPMLVAFIFAWLGAFALGSFKIDGRTEYSPVGKIVGGVLGLVFGLGLSFLFRLRLRWTVRATAQTAYNRMGPKRTVTWNSEGIAFQSAFLETKAGWRMIDKIEVGEVGVYGLMSRSPLFAIPKSVFPPTAPLNDLIQAWQNNTRKPPIIA